MYFKFKTCSRWKQQQIAVHEWKMQLNRTKKNSSFVWNRPQYFSSFLIAKYVYLLFLSYFVPFWLYFVKNCLISLISWVETMYQAQNLLYSPKQTSKGYVIIFWTFSRSCVLIKGDYVYVCNGVTVIYLFFAKCSRGYIFSRNYVYSGL